MTVGEVNYEALLMLHDNDINYLWVSGTGEAWWVCKEFDTLEKARKKMLVSNSGRRTGWSFVEGGSLITTKVFKVIDGHEKISDEDLWE